MEIALHTTLRHLALVTWAVPQECLAPLLPEGLVPATLEGPEGPLGLFSVAVMLEEGMAPRSARWLGLTFPQLNERAYVTRPDGSDPGVFFWRSLVSTPAGLLPRWFLGLPYEWQNLSLSVKEESLSFSVQKKTALRLSLEAPPTGGVFDHETISAHIANPMIGYSLVRQKHLTAFRVEHPPIVPREATVIEASTKGLVAESALSPGQAPLHACYAQEARFTIFLPPRRL